MILLTNMYLMGTKKEERLFLNKAKQIFLSNNLEISKVSDADVINEALKLYIKKGGKYGRRNNT